MYLSKMIKRIIYLKETHNEIPTVKVIEELII